MATTQASQGVALVTGGTRGIGLAICHVLAKAGYDILTCARTSAEVDVFAGRFADLPIKAKALCGDVCDDVFLAELVQVAKQMGPIRALVNNAGGGKKNSIAKATTEEWDFILNLNLRAPMLLTKLVLPDLTATPGGIVINIASLAGKTGMPETSAYCAAKFGLVGFAQSLFEETRTSGLKTCTLCPGYVDTNLIPYKKSLDRQLMIQPEDVACAVQLVLDSSPSACPVEIQIRPQTNPFK